MTDTETSPLGAAPGPRTFTWKEYGRLVVTHVEENRRGVRKAKEEIHRIDLEKVDWATFRELETKVVTIEVSLARVVVKVALAGAIATTIIVIAAAVLGSLL